MRLSLNLFTILSSCTLLMPNTLWGKDMSAEQARYRPTSGWSNAIQANAQTLLATDLDDGGHYRNQKMNLQASRNYLWDPQTSASFAVSYGYADYDFSGGSAGTLAESSPWNKVHTLSLSTPLRKGINQRWSGFLIPYVRFAGESDAEFNHAMTAGAFAAAAYRFSKNLTIGPGIGVSSQLEDSTSVFPLLMIRWNINDQLSFNLGSSMEGNQGPGITLSYKADRQWKYTLGGYYENLRFRLDNSGTAADGIGESTAFPVIASATYNLNPVTKVTLMTGLQLSGELKVEDSGGDTVFEESTDTGILAGIYFSMRL